MEVLMCNKLHLTATRLPTLLMVGIKLKHASKLRLWERSNASCGQEKGFAVEAEPLRTRTRLADYRRNLRRAMPARPKAPLPNSTSVLGSGVVPPDCWTVTLSRNQ